MNVPTASSPSFSTETSTNLAKISLSFVYWTEIDPLAEKPSPLSVIDTNESQRNNSCDAIAVVVVGDGVLVVVDSGVVVDSTVVVMATDVVLDNGWTSRCGVKSQQNRFGALPSDKRSWMTIEIAFSSIDADNASDEPVYDDWDTVVLNTGDHNSFVVSTWFKRFF